MRDLTRANELIATISKENPHITPIESGDFDLFQSFFAKEPHTYGNSWTYITQGMYGVGPNKLGYKYYDGKNLSAVCVYPKVEKPDQLVLFWIRPMGATMMSTIAEVSKKIHKDHGINVYAKKLFKEQNDQLLGSGFSDVSIFPWHSLYPMEDDSFPEQIIDIQHTVDTAKPLGVRERLGSANRYYESYVKDGSLTGKPLNECQSDAMRVLEEFFEYSKTHTKLPIISAIDDYCGMVTGVALHDTSLDKFVYLDEKPIGFYVAERQDSQQASMYALITLRAVSNHIVDYMMFDLFNRLVSQGVKYLNLGGSENENVDFFKKKFIPIKTQQMYWACLV